MFQIRDRETIKTHFMLDKFYVENRAVYEIVWENTVDSNMSQVTIRCMRIACWIPKATNTLSEYVILIAFPL